jgi:single-stranded DNA-binding protein
MNSIVLMAEVLTEPELRYTPDSQNAIASFLVQFPSSRAEEPPHRIKVVGWNNLANEVMEKKYHRGARVLIEGRLRCDSYEKDGRKEKRTEITASRIHSLDGISGSSSVEVSYRNAPPPKPIASDTAQDDVPF